MKQDFFENDYAEYWIEDGIVMECFKPELKKIDIDIGKRIVQDRINHITKGFRMPLFVDINKCIYVDRECREYFSGTESLSDIKVSALLIKSPIARIAAKLFISINKPKAKFEFFKDRNSALSWLMKYR